LKHNGAIGAPQFPVGKRRLVRLQYCSSIATKTGKVRIWRAALGLPIVVESERIWRMSFWTADRDRELMRLKKLGHSAARIAATLGSTRGAVIGRWHRLQGTQFASVSKRRSEEAARRAQNRACRDDHRQKVAAFLKNVIDRGACRDAAIVEARHGGATLQEIGDFFGLTRERVRQLEERAKSAA
jgi:hypothetical protein